MDDRILNRIKIYPKPVSPCAGSARLWTEIRNLFA
jgi:hypothetical protein